MRSTGILALGVGFALACSGAGGGGSSSAPTGTKASTSTDPRPSSVSAATSTESDESTATEEDVAAETASNTASETDTGTSEDTETQTVTATSTATATVTRTAMTIENLATSDNEFVVSIEVEGVEAPAESECAEDGGDCTVAQLKKLCVPDDVTTISDMLVSIDGEPYPLGGGGLRTLVVNSVNDEPTLEVQVRFQAATQATYRLSCPDSTALELAD